MQAEQAAEHGHARDIQVGALLMPLRKYEIDVVAHSYLYIKYLDVKITGRARRRQMRHPETARPASCETGLADETAGRSAYWAASFSFLSGRTLTLTEAGLAGNQRSSPVHGSLPKRLALAGTFCTVNLNRSEE